MLFSAGGSGNRKQEIRDSVTTNRRSRIKKTVTYEEIKDFDYDQLPDHL